MTPADVNVLIGALSTALPAWPWERTQGGRAVVAHRPDLKLFAVVGTNRLPAVGPSSIWTLLAVETPGAIGPRGRGWHGRVVEQMKALVEQALFAARLLS